ncbi:hypothetical protein HanIR_Chr04g0163011 [Helianthus annuus]|nr:hypothetical protein HanIR_Chr04g0163011 [Helianthus annuus]
MLIFTKVDQPVLVYKLLTYCDMVRFGLFGFDFLFCFDHFFGFIFVGFELFSCLYVFVSVRFRIFSFDLVAFFGSVSVFSNFLFCFVLVSSVRF